MWLKIALTIISLTLAIIMKISIDWSGLQDNYFEPSPIKELLYDLFVGVFSAMILVWFIDEIGNHIQERQSQQKEKAAIKRFNKILQQYIDQYVTMFYCVATPLDARDIENAEMPEHFTLSDMRDLHKPSLLIKEKFLGDSIEPFLQIELILRNEFISLVEKNDFEHFPNFAEIFLKYIQISICYDSRSVILDISRTKNIGTPSLAQIVHDLLENNADSYYQQILNGENINGNLVHPYIYLYELMKEERKLILQYKDEIQKIS